MAVLELCAVDFDYCARVLEQSLRGRLDDSRLARSGGPQEQKVADRAARRAHPREIHLIDVDDLLDGLILTDN